jgi:hypothetical protein
MFEARLLLEGYVCRHDELGDNQPWNVRDDILWQGLLRVTVKKYGDGWDWVISQIICGKNVPDVLKSAGRWWAAREGSLEEDQSIPERRSYEPQQQESSGERKDHILRQRYSKSSLLPSTDEDMQVDKDAEGSVSAGEDAEPKDAAHQTNEDAGESYLAALQENVDPNWHLLYFKVQLHQTVECAWATMSMGPVSATAIYQLGIDLIVRFICTRQWDAGGRKYSWFR